MQFQNWSVQEHMDKLSPNPTAAKRGKAERRASRRCKFTQLMRIRPSDPQRTHFDDMRGTISVSRTGVYFQTSETGYEVGMRLFLIMPYSQDPGSTNREYLAEVVRKDSLANGLTGIGVKLLLETGPQHTYSFEPPTPRR
jgi:PilZ domain